MWENDCHAVKNLLKISRDKICSVAYVQSVSYKQMNKQTNKNYVFVFIIQNLFINNGSAVVFFNNNQHYNILLLKSLRIKIFLALCEKTVLNTLGTIYHIHYSFIVSEK